VLDSYQRFFSKGYISEEDFFDFGISETIFVDFGKASEAWDQLKGRIITNEPVYIRGFGRDANGTHLFQTFYRHLLGNENILKDSTNNAEPTKLLRIWTGYSKSGGNGYEPIRNYQVSHVFGRTKNVYCFTAPWNIVYVPKIVDPFTGHEAKGEFVEAFTQRFQLECYKKFKPLIEDFNEIMSEDDFIRDIQSNLKLLRASNKFDDKDLLKLEKAIQSELSPILIDA
tara:strand:- start:1688 stop:2368 length:681 start_codon:yes stop_codon:yes gene_type:complete